MIVFVVTPRLSVLRLNVEYAAVELAARKQIQPHSHQVVSTERADSLFCATFDVRFRYRVLARCIESAQTDRLQVLIEAGVDVESEENGLVTLFVSVESGCVLSRVGRYETIPVAIEDNLLEAVVIGYGLAAVRLLFVSEVIELDVETEFAHHRYIDAELDGSCAVPCGDMRALRFDREYLGVAPLDEKALNRVGVVARPKFSEILECLIVCTSATS